MLGVADDPRLRDPFVISESKRMGEPSREGADDETVSKNVSRCQYVFRDLAKRMMMIRGRVKDAVLNAHAQKKRLNLLEIEAVESLILENEMIINENNQLIRRHWEHATTQLNLIQDRIRRTLHEETFRVVLDERSFRHRTPPTTAPLSLQSPLILNPSYNSFDRRSPSPVQNDLMSFFGTTRTTSRASSCSFEDDDSYNNYFSTSQDWSPHHGLTFTSFLVSEIAFHNLILKGFLACQVEGMKFHTAMLRIQKGIDKMQQNNHQNSKHIQLFSEDVTTALARLRVAVSTSFWPPLSEASGLLIPDQTETPWMDMMQSLLGTAAHYTALNTLSNAQDIASLISAEKRVLRTEWNVLLSNAQCKGCSEKAAHFITRCCRTPTCARCICSVILGISQASDKFIECCWCRAPERYSNLFVIRALLGSLGGIILNRMTQIGQSVVGELGMTSARRRTAAEDLVASVLESTLDEA